MKSTTTAQSDVLVSTRPHLRLPVIKEATSLHALISLANSERGAIPVTAPFTGDGVGSVPRGTPEDVVEATKRARAAQVAWAALEIKERAEIFLRFHDIVLERQNELLDLIQLEGGKARKNALEEVLDTAIVARYYGFHAKDHLRPRRRKGGVPFLTATWEYHHPIGVVGCIVPWNYPLNLVITDAIPALIAGNTAVIKPDHQTSFTALKAVSFLYEAGLPREVLHIVTGIGPELGPSMIDSVDFIMFTGSTRTGKLIARQAGERLIGSSLELGGKNPMIVLADADLEAAVEGAVRGSFVGAGQVCVSIERIYVHSSIYDHFIERFARRTREMRIGPCFDYETDMGSLTSERQLATVVDHVSDAISKGAKVVAGGKARPDLGPLFFEPTVLVDVRPGMRAFAEETFGPVVSVYRFDSIEEAIERANETRYGLNASVWSKSARGAIEVAKRVKAGTVNINEAYASTWASVDAPIGGMKESGMGRRHGREGLLKYTETQTVSVQRLLPLAAPKWLGEERYGRLMTWALRLMKRIPGLR